MVKNLVIALWMAGSGICFGQTIAIGPQETVYPVGQVPSYKGRGWPPDAVVSTLKKNDSTLIWFWPEQNYIQRFEGTLNRPRSVATGNEKYNIWDFMMDWAIQDPAIHAPASMKIYNTCWQTADKTGGPLSSITVPIDAATSIPVSVFHDQSLIEKFLPEYGCVWLKNIHQINGDTLLGFCHCEVFKKPAHGEKYEFQNRRYSIGLSYSTDQGMTWKFVGEVIKPNYNAYTFSLNNINGCPYFVVGEYFYVYFAETLQNANIPGGLEYRYAAVARAKVVDVVNAVKRGAVTPWVKYNNGAWNQSALTGVASNVIWPQSGAAALDICSDAARCAPTGKTPFYVISALEWDVGPTFARLALHFSRDGVNWDTDPSLPWKEVVRTPSNNPNRFQFSFFAGLKGADNTSTTVGNEFYVYYPQTEYYQSPFSIVRHKITVN